MSLHIRKSTSDSGLDPAFASSLAQESLPAFKFPESEQDPDSTYQIVKDELMLDGNARQNLATFCQTFEEPAVHRLMDDCIQKNMIDKDEYPQTAEIERRCVHMLADLWNSPEAASTVGCSTTGSSEACMLGGLAMIHRWRKTRKAQGKPFDKPNLVCGPVQVCWEKFARYWDVELRQVPMDHGRYISNGEQTLKYVDENTIGVVVTLGTTFTGLYESVDDIAKALDEWEKKTGQSIDIHIDGASGGFLAPFCAPDLVWDFRVPRVKSISASGHKFGLAPLGAGWVVWRDAKDLPEELVFYVNYLGGNMPTFALNFSRPAGQIIAQYYNFIRLGKEGYAKLQNASYAVAQYLASEVVKLGPFELIYDGNPLTGIPALTWKFKEGASAPYSLYDFAEKLRTKGWLVPAYSLPVNCQDVVVQRILCRRGFSKDLASLLVNDMKSILASFDKHPVKVPLSSEEGTAYHH